MYRQALDVTDLIHAILCTAHPRTCHPALLHLIPLSKGPILPNLQPTVS